MASRQVRKAAWLGLFILAGACGEETNLDTSPSDASTDAPDRADGPSDARMADTGTDAADARFSDTGGDGSPDVGVDDGGMAPCLPAPSRTASWASGDFYEVQTAPVPYADERSTPGRSDLPRRGTAVFELPFEFALYGTTYPAGTEVTISTSGFLSFEGSAVVDRGEFPESAPRDIIAPFWHDGPVEAVSVDLDPSKLTVIWHGIGGAVVTGGTLTVELTLDAVTNAIHFLYAVARDGTFAGTVGIASMSGDYEQLPCSPDCDLVNVSEGTAIRFVPVGATSGVGDLRVLCASRNDVPESLYVDEVASYRFQLAAEVENVGDRAVESDLFFYASPVEGRWSIGGNADQLQATGLMSNFPSPILAPGERVLTEFTIDPSLMVGLPPGRFDLAVLVFPSLSSPRVNNTDDLVAIGTIEVLPLIDTIIIDDVELRGAVGVEVDQTLTSNAPAPTWSSEDLPSFLTLDATGRLNGTPTMSGGWAFEVTAMQAHYETGVRRFLLTVR